MSIFYLSERVGLNGKPFHMYKVRTLKPGRSSSFAHEHEYVWGGKFMRKFRIDELPQLWNMLKRDMNLVGPRPMDRQTYFLYPPHIQNILTSVRPGLFGLAGIHFMDEEQMLKLSKDPTQDYYEKILPIKLALDMFYIENRCLSLDIWIIYQALKRRIKTALWK